MTTENKWQLIYLLREYRAEILADYTKSVDKGADNLSKSEFTDAILMDKHIKYIDEIIEVMLYDV